MRGRERDELVNYFNESWLMSWPVPLDCKLVTWQLFYLFAQHASAINNFATLLLRQHTTPIAFNPSYSSMEKIYKRSLKSNTNYRMTHIIIINFYFPLSKSKFDFSFEKRERERLLKPFSSRINSYTLILVFFGSAQK